MADEIIDFDFIKLHSDTGIVYDVLLTKDVEIIADDGVKMQLKKGEEFKIKKIDTGIEILSFTCRVHSYYRSQIIKKLSSDSYVIKDKFFYREIECYICTHVWQGVFEKVMLNKCICPNCSNETLT